MKTTDIKPGDLYRIRVSRENWLVARVTATRVLRYNGGRRTHDGVNVTFVGVPEAETALRDYARWLHRDDQVATVRPADVLGEYYAGWVADQLFKADAEKQRRLLREEWMETEVAPKRRALHAALRALVDERLADESDFDRRHAVTLGYEGTRVDVSINADQLAKLLGLDIETPRSFHDWNVCREADETATGRNAR